MMMKRSSVIFIVVYIYRNDEDQVHTVLLLMPLCVGRRGRGNESARSACGNLILNWKIVFISLFRAGFFPQDMIILGERERYIHGPEKKCKTKHNI